jgi:Na+-transporting NADH:ubiquinone oxidoreductase subunit NqrF
MGNNMVNAQAYEVEAILAPQNIGSWNDVWYKISEKYATLVEEIFSKMQNNNMATVWKLSLSFGLITDHWTKCSVSHH